MMNGNEEPEEVRQINIYHPLYSYRTASLQKNKKKYKKLWMKFSTINYMKIAILNNY